MTDDSLEDEVPEGVRLSQKKFREALPKLLETDKGKWVLFTAKHDGPVKFGGTKFSLHQHATEKLKLSTDDFVARFVDYELTEKDYDGAGGINHSPEDGFPEDKKNKKFGHQR